MAIITLNKRIFEKEIGKLNEEMQEKISMFGTPVESINSEEIQIEVFPNRPDLLSYQGFKRSFLAFLGKKTGLREYKFNPPKKDYKVIVDSSVKDVRPHTACAIIHELQFDEEKIKEIIEIQEKLHATLGRKRKKIAIGIYPLEKIKLPITFTAREPDKIKFVPLESEKEMSGLEILQHHPTGIEYSPLLAGQRKFPIFIDSDNNVLSMPPIINSQKTGKVDSSTKSVFIECSGFDMEVLEKCINMLSTCMADMGGKVYKMEVQYPSEKKTYPNLKPEEMRISLEGTNKFLGLKLNEKEMKNLLERMGHKYDKGKVFVPAWRTDVLHEVDLIEDVAIAFGYENFIPEIPEISTIGEESKKEILKRKFSEILSGLGLLEVSNYHLTNKNDQFKKMKSPEENFIEVEESKTEYTILRKNLSHYIMKNLSENIDVEYPQKIFEIGKVFDLENGISEKECLSIAIAPGNFTEIRQVLEYFANEVRIELKFSEPKEAPENFISGRVAEITFKNKLIGFLGEVHPKILKNWKIKMPISLLEISLENIIDELY
ncbi:phenylalanine--tRNA ligase subunit beta [Candidatus Pacearchaeota archaeon CG10_big_fil_rev_8_21_14_0_10_34_12]|nr:MAG: phenylalanine--tRNA ligase subunit beta [Candidatus Pacearchaeota archaeon CG10_big_fil_rev_8_21_14_0_10_34_12]